MDKAYLLASASGEGVGKKVEWHLEDLGIAISLKEIITVAEREFPGVPFSDLRIGGSAYYNSIDYSGGDYSEVRLSHKDNT